MSTDPEEIIDQGLRPNPLDAPLPDGIPFEISPREALIELSKVRGGEQEVEPSIQGQTLESLREQLIAMGMVPAFQSAPSVKAKGYYGLTHAPHGARAEVKTGPGYECADCRDLYERIRKAFKEMGHEF